MRACGRADAHERMHACTHVFFFLGASGGGVYFSLHINDNIANTIMDAIVILMPNGNKYLFSDFLDKIIRANPKLIEITKPKICDVVKFILLEPI